MSLHSQSTTPGINNSVQVKGNSEGHDTKYDLKIPKLLLSCSLVQFKTNEECMVKALPLFIHCDRKLQYTEGSYCRFSIHL